MWKLAIDAIKALKPPELTDDDEDLDPEDAPYKVMRYDARNRRWRWVVFGWLMFLTAMAGLTVFLLALAWGLAPWYSGFAMADSEKKNKVAIEALEKRVDELKEALTEEQRQARIEQLQGVLFDLRWKQCQAKWRGESQAAFTVQITSMQNRYKRLDRQGQPYTELPSCDELR